jgi:hypothetical protein
VPAHGVVIEGPTVLVSERTVGIGSTRFRLVMRRVGRSRRLRLSAPICVACDQPVQGGHETCNWQRLQVP